MGPFIRGSREIAAIDYLKKWRFHPLRNKGEEVGPGEEVGYLEEGPFRHYVMNKTSGRQKVSWLADGEVSMNDPLGGFESGEEILGCMEWPVRAARPYRKKYAPSMPLRYRAAGHRLPLFPCKGRYSDPAGRLRHRQDDPRTGHGKICGCGYRCLCRVRRAGQ